MMARSLAIAVFVVVLRVGSSQLDLLLSSEQCPSRCRCDESTLDVTCRNVDFSIGDFYRLPTWTSTLTLHRANIHTLYDRSFVTMLNLTSLTIQNSQLKAIEPNALVGLNRLRTLRLPSNLLIQLPAAFLANSPNLQVVSFADNLISSLPNGLFDLCPLLKEIRLEQNSLKTVPNSLVAKVPLLKRLSLASNLLQELPASFVASASINHIDVSFNAIRFVSPDALMALPQLHSIDLSHNLLTHINPASLISRPQLTRIALDHNPLICDCQLAPLRAYWASLSIEDSPSDMAWVPPTCAWPQKFNGVAINKLSSSDFICTTTTTTTTLKTTTPSPTTTSRATTILLPSTTAIPLWLLNYNSTGVAVPAGTEQVMEASSQESSSSGLPMDVVVALIASLLALLLTLSIALVIICYRKKQSKSRPRAIVVSTSPKRFQLSIPGKPTTENYATSTPYNNMINNVARVGDIEKQLGNDRLSSASSSSGSPPSPPSGSTSIPSSSQNCIFSSQPNSSYPVLMPDGGVAMMNSNGGLIQTVIDQLDYTTGVLVGAPHTFSLTRQHHQNAASADLISDALPNNIIVDMTGFAPLGNGTVVRSESLV